MRLESIALHGFKSFGEKTVVRVLPGITGIVGPNGCGKSNISEAVRWALGEQSAKSLRGQRMEDLIFHGSQSRKPVGLAEVELTFRNDGTLSVPWAEVSVARRLYRTGESEYLLNNSAARLRDILDLFAGTGANPRAYSVIDQDKLNHVLTAKPHDRRVFIEEAAGIARYKQQRNETQGKLDATKQNLVRVRDVMDEVKRQLSSLERQAKKAQQYKPLQTTKRDLSLVVLAAEYMARVAEGERRAVELSGLRDREQTLRTRAAQLAAQEAQQRERLQESDHRLSDLRQSGQKVQGELEQPLELALYLLTRLAEVRELAEEALRLDEETRATADRLGAIVGEREAGRQALAEASRLTEERARTADAIAAALERHRETLAAERDRAEATRLEQVRVAAERVDLTRHAGELRERAAQLSRRAERLAAELSDATAEAAGIDALRASLVQARDVAQTELRALAGERAELATRLAAEGRRLAAAGGALAEARVTLAAHRSSLDALAALERAREGYGAGVRAVFDPEHAEALTGVMGTVADLLEVPLGMERAIEAVLGERLQWVVVERVEHARAAVEYLGAHSLGAATFLPLEHLPPPTGPQPDANDARWVACNVGAPSLSLVHHLLGQVAIVEHLDQAEALWRRNGVVATYVTPAGEVLGPTGRLHGGGQARAADVEHSLLARKRRLRELDDEVRRVSTNLDETQERVARFETEVSAIRGQVAEIERTLHARETERLASEKDLEQATREHDRVHRHRETIEVEARQVALEAEETDGTLAQLEQRVTLARDAETAHEARMARLREAIETAQVRETELVAETTACRVALASTTERVEALGRELTRIDDIERDLTARIDQARARQAQLTDRRAWLAEERERTDASAREIAVERDRMDVEVRQAAEGHEGLAEELRAIEADQRAVDGDLGRLVASIHEIDLGATECRVRREELAQEAWRAYGVDEAALAARPDPAGDLETVRGPIVEAEESGDPLDTGVDLMAQPRGKRLQSVTLLSGGERALTGLALLFAIFYFRPSPFCVLDEVDAPLDDANIHRFLRVLRELTSLGRAHV